MTEHAPLPDRLENAAQAVKDDIRGVFRRAAPEYKDYLVALLREAATALRTPTKPEHRQEGE